MVKNRGNGETLAMSTNVFRIIFRNTVAALFLYAPSITLAAEWSIITHSNMDSNETTNVAIVENDEGYSLEIYKDSVDAVRARFTLSRGLLRFPDNFCPTFQIDSGAPRNRSINDAPCLSGTNWSEFILGYVENGTVNSATVTGLMNGVGLRFRFMLENGDYRETLFSLRGSMRAMSTALGTAGATSPATPD